MYYDVHSEIENCVDSSSTSGDRPGIPSLLDPEQFDTLNDSIATSRAFLQNSESEKLRLPSD